MTGNQQTSVPISKLGTSLESMTDFQERTGPDCKEANGYMKNALGFHCCSTKELFTDIRKIASGDLSRIE